MLPVINFSHISPSRFPVWITPAPFSTRASQPWVTSFPARTEELTQSAVFAGEVENKSLLGISWG